MENQENLGEVLFVNETSLTKRYLREYLRRSNRGRVLNMVLMAALFSVYAYKIIELVLLCRAWQQPLLWSDVSTTAIYCLLSVLFFVFYWQLPRINAWQHFRRIKTYVPTASMRNRYLFGEHISVQGDENITQIPYEHISKIIPTSFGCALVIAKSSALLIDRDGFTQGTYTEFCHFLQERCVNLNKKSRQITPPQLQQSCIAPTADTPPANFVNETTATQKMLVHYYKRVVRFRIPLALVYTLFSVFALRQLFVICLLAIESPASVAWWSIPLLVVCTAVILFATIHLWRLPWLKVRKGIKNHQRYHGEPYSTVRYSFGEQILIQSKNACSVSEYQEISKIIDTDFGCAIVMAKTVAFMISAKGFTQGSYNDFRQFLSTKCPHLDKKHKS